jgi:hypothetical protein
MLRTMSRFHPEVRMKRFMAIAIVSFASLAAGALARAQAPKPSQMPPPKPSTPVFDQIKALAGEWEGKASNGTPGRTSYRVVSNGSAVMNLLNGGTEPEMVTMFHLDGKSVMVTHYCSMGNQPRMVAKPDANPKAIEFTFKDATNLSTPGEAHMSGLILRVIDANHHQQEWIFSQDGKQLRDVFDFTRVK